MTSQPPVQSPVRSTVQHHPRRSALRAVTGTAVAVAVAVAAVPVSAGAAPAPRTAAAALQAVTGAELTWSLNREQGSGAFFGGCNFLSAGKAGNTGSSRLWTEADGFYATESGNVAIEKLTAAGGYATPSWATKCQNADGTAVTPGNNLFTGNRVHLSAGTGIADVTAGTATVQWTGSFTAVSYGGLTYWSATDPKLTVAADGTGTLTATLSGYGADRDNPGTWVPLTPRTAHLATLTDVNVGASGISLTPDYLDVAVSGTGITQVAKTADNAAYWGAFPQDFVDFQVETGQAAYWYTSGGSRDAAKPAAPLATSWTLADLPDELTITRQPAAVSVAAGGSRVFSVAASGASSYHWQVARPGSDHFSPIVGADSASYTAKPKSVTENGSRYRVVVGNGSTTAVSTAATLTVTQAVSVLRANLPTAVVHGRGGQASVRVTAAGLVPTGTVVLRSGTTTMGTGRLTDGVARLTIPGTLRPAHYPVTLDYLGSREVTATSTRATLTVVPASASLTVTAPAKAKVGTPVTTRVRVSATGVVPSGTVTVSDGSRALVTVRLNSGAATAVVPATLSVGTHRLTYSYRGSATVKATTRVVTVVVVR